jgi:hypothetical protein
MLEVIITSVLISLTLYITMQPGELFQGVARFINTRVGSSFIRKLLLCPYCLAGQLAFWTVCVIHYYLFLEGGLLPLSFLKDLIWSVCGSIVTVWLFVKIQNKYL